MLEIIIVAAILLLDQSSKIVCASWLTTLPENTYRLLPDIFHLTYVENRGAAFGMLQNARAFFLVMTFIVCAVIIWYLIKERKKLHFLLRFSLALILGGAIGNFIDRALLGYVRDMFSAVIINFAVFNVADSAISVGTVLLFLDLMFFKGKYLLEANDKKTDESETQESEPEMTSEQETLNEREDAER